MKVTQSLFRPQYVGVVGEVTDYDAGEHDYAALVGVRFLAPIMIGARVAQCAWFHGDEIVAIDRCA